MSSEVLPRLMGVQTFDIVSCLVTCSSWLHGQHTMARAPTTLMTASAMLAVLVIALQAVDGATSAECRKVRVHIHYYTLLHCFDSCGSLVSIVHIVAP
jgi:hypothetical protein